MLKCLAVLIVLFCLTVIAMPTQQKPPSKQDAQQSSRDAKQADVPAASITNNQATSYYEQPRESKPQGWHKLVAWPEGVTTWAIMLTLGAIVWQAWETRKAANASKLAAEAARDSADAYVTSERPFVMIETRGEQGFEFWAVNYGKSPAQIIFSNPAPFVITPLIEDLPESLNYGFGFDNPNSEQINVQWIAPGKSHSLGSFQPEIMNFIEEDAAKELSQSLRVMLVYSAFKYRGIHSKQVYTSTYCYRKYPVGLQMWGGYGWNQYT
jgi:hypothetical protein